MKISQEHAILITNLYLSKQYDAQWLLNELADRSWKLRSIDSLPPKDSYNCLVTRQRKTRLSRNSGGPCAVRWTSQKGTYQPVIAWNCHSLLKCVHDNSPWSPAQMLHTTSCSAVVWSQSHLPSHSLINNLTICNKSCYCSLINHKLNNK